MINPTIGWDNKNKIAIVAIGYNRLKSMRRLLTSLVNAQYGHKDIPLVISIDCSGDTELYNYVNEFEWKYGQKYVNIQEKRLGLKNHILQCGDLTRYFRAVIVLEDDIFVSEYFYQYVEKAVDFYYGEDRIGGISLYQNEMGGALPVLFMNDGSDTYLKMGTASWGECWTDRQWNKFKEWYSDFTDDCFYDIDMPENMKKWTKAWSKYYKAYLTETNRYFVFPQVSHTTCFVDSGEHSTNSSNIGQANLLCGPPRYYFKPFDEMIRYDTYGTNELVYKWLGMSSDELCVDFRCNKINFRKCRYILTPAILPCKVVRSFGLKMRPMELNIKYDIEGNELFLYDTIDGKANAASVGNPGTISNYYLRGYDVRLAAKYVFRYYISAIKRNLRIKK